MTEHDLLITVKDFHVVGICKTSKRWFASHGRDWLELREGIPLSWFRQTGEHDRKVNALEAAARRRLGVGDT